MKSPQGWQYGETLQILQSPKYTHVLMLMRTKQQMILQEEMSLYAMDAIQIFDIQVWLLHARCGSSHQNTTKVVTLFLGGACCKFLQHRYPGVTAICQMYKFMYNTWARAANQGATNWGAAFNAGMHIMCVEKQHHRIRKHCVPSIQILKLKGQCNTQPLNNKLVAAQHTTHHALYKHEWSQSSHNRTTETSLSI